MLGLPACWASRVEAGAGCTSIGLRPGLLGRREWEPGYAAARDKMREGKDFPSSNFLFYFKTNFKYESNIIQILFRIYFQFKNRIRTFVKFFKK